MLKTILFVNNNRGFLPVLTSFSIQWLSINWHIDTHWDLYMCVFDFIEYCIYLLKKKDLYFLYKKKWNDQLSEVMYLVQWMYLKRNNNERIETKEYIKNLGYVIMKSNP